MRLMSEDLTQVRVRRRNRPKFRSPPEKECEVCGSEMYGVHCKLVCPNCGYRRDCSDP